MEKQHNRIIGLDVARAVAIIGMTIDHFGPATWAPWVMGWPSILFAFLSGMSMALITRHGLSAGVAMSRIWQRIAIRGLILLVIGVLLASAGPDMLIVLTTLGISFLLCTMLVSLRGPTLLALGATGMFVLPQLAHWLRQNVFQMTGDELGVVPRLEHFTSVDGAGIALRAVLLDGMYPALTWLPVIVFGMGVMTIGVDGAKRILWLIVGTASALVSCVFTWVMYTYFDVRPSMLEAMGLPLDDLAETSDSSVFAVWRTFSSSMGTTNTSGDLLLNGAHTGSTPELLLTTGLSLVIIALCLWAGDLFRRGVFPLTALGSCAFTVYTGHALASAAINHWLPDIHDEPGTSLLPVTCYLGISLVFCVVWKHYFRRGPLEQVMHLASNRGDR